MGIGELTALVPLGTVLGFAALLLRRWWTQQDNAMAAAVEASTREAQRCEERIAAIRQRHEAELAALRVNVERLREVVRRMVPMVTDVDDSARLVALLDVMWTGDERAPSPSGDTSS